MHDCGTICISPWKDVCSHFCFFFFCFCFFLFCFVFACLLSGFLFWGFFFIAYIIIPSRVSKTVFSFYLPFTSYSNSKLVLTCQSWWWIRPFKGQIYQPGFMHLLIQPLFQHSHSLSLSLSLSLKHTHTHTHTNKHISLHHLLLSSLVLSFFANVYS